MAVQAISPDLSRENWDIPASVGVYTNTDMNTMPRRGVIYTVAPSYKNINTIWCGTDDGLIHITNDGGKSWKNITPPGISAWSKISLMDAGHFDNTTVYAAVNRIRCDDMHPHIYKTHDGGKSWKEIVNGLPEDPINAVREDPKVKGLLFAGSERAVYVSFDDGEHWQSLRLNMPATSVRDLVIKDDDLVIGTHGRSFWILDNITPLRQSAVRMQTNGIINSETMFGKSILYKPQTAYRVRWNTYPDTPAPQEEPAGENPPDGAIIDYYLQADVTTITLEISRNNAAGKMTLVRTYSNKDTLYKTGEQNIPEYWIRPQTILSAAAGHHRFAWDMKYDPLNVPPSYPIGAIYMNTAPEATAPWVMPGMYTARLIIDGNIFQEQFEIKMDPRVKTTTADLQKQHDLSLACYQSRKKCMELSEEVHRFRVLLQSNLVNAPVTVADKLGPIEKSAGLLENTAPGSQASSFGKLTNTFAAIFNTLQDNDWPPTSQAIAAVAAAQQQLKLLLNQWSELKAKQSGN
jgi:hypothetical protein